MSDTHPLQEALAEARAVQERVDRLCASLAVEPDPEGEGEQELAALLEERRRLVHRIGLEALKWSLAGGQLDLVPEPSDDEPDEGGDTLDDEADADEATVAAEQAAVEAEPEPVAAGQAAAEAAPAVAPAEETSLSEAPTEVSAGHRRRGERHAEPPSAPPPPPSRPATAADLVQLASGLGPNWNQKSEVGGNAKLLLEALHGIGKPEQVTSPGRYVAEVDRLARVADALEQWLPLPTDDQRELLALAVCKLRHLQDEVDDGHRRAAADDQLSRLFPAMTRFSAEYRPGYVHGLRRSHTSRPKESWIASARHWWEGLCERAGLVEEPDPAAPNPEVALDLLERTLHPELRPETARRAFLDALKALDADDPRLVRLARPWLPHLDDPRLKSLRRAIRADDDEGRGDDETEDTLAVPPDWPLWPRIRGKHAVIVGGDSRPEAARRIEQAFDLGSVTWDDDVVNRRLHALADRVRNRSIDLVLFLARFSSHEAQSVLLDACKDAGVPFVRIEHGYGVTRIRRALEETMPASS